MHNTVKNLVHIQEEINLNNNSHNPKIIAVSKTFKMDNILPLIEYGHLQFGENKVQEAIEKWSEIKTNNSKIELHMLGKLQTNKVKHALKIFDFIHSLDSTKLANKISTEQKKINKKPKLFIQINIGEEPQKSGIKISEFEQFYSYCNKLELEIIGTMCLPPDEQDPSIFFSKMKELNEKFNIPELSMGMSNDYMIAIKYMASYLRIGSKIFGVRS
tara:strand:- start:3171 stop:3818 length:648 start_codon:yes stop_codon:yes gene_type:complete